MWDLIIVLAVAALISTIFTPLTIKLAQKYGLVDDPNKRPHPAHIHQRAIPRAGGVPVFITILLCSLIFLPFQKYLIGIFLGSFILLVMGLLDDKLKEFNPYVRLILLFVAAGVAVGSGIGISYVSNPLYHFPLFNISNQSSVIQLDQVILYFNFLGSHKIILIADLLALFWIVILTQVINWAKGVDGQMPGITFVAALILGLFSLKLFLAGDPSQLNVAKLSFIVSGASLGLLIFNWYPSKILPGFSGSTIPAFLLAVLSIMSGAKLATAILTLAIPMIDFFYTFFRRIIQGKSPVWGDRGHFHHRLLDLGWSHRQISLFYMLGSGIFGAGAILLETSSKLFILGILVLMFLAFILWLNSLGVYSGKSGQNSGVKTLPSSQG